MSAHEKVRIVVVGDSGVGKTSLVHQICYDEPLSNPGWTIGCTVEIKVHDYKEGTSAARSVCLELWDVGGSTGHKKSRSIFYGSVNGIILVHDLTNKKSYTNLRKWLAEVLNQGKEFTGVTINKSKDRYFNDEDEYDPEQFAGNQIPIIIVGTKLDQTSFGRAIHTTRGVNLAEEVGADVLNMDCRDCKHLSPRSPGQTKLNSFFDKVIERKFYARDSLQFETPRTTESRPFVKKKLI